MALEVVEGDHRHVHGGSPMNPLRPARCWAALERHCLYRQEFLERILQRNWNMQVVHSSHLWGQLGVLGSQVAKSAGRAEGLLLLANEGKKPSAYALRLFRCSVVSGLLAGLPSWCQPLDLGFSIDGAGQRLRVEG